MTTVQKHFDFGANAQLDTREFICGCEFEIESIKDDTNVARSGLFHIDIDHSLRNNGKEYKTLPCSLKDTLERFEFLHKNLKFGKEEPFSERTSIHVHVNVRSLGLSEVRQLVLLYALLEPVFFSYVGEGRKNNIFCVPLNYTYLPSLYKSSATDMHKKWHKYTAFNLLPIGPMANSPGCGTVEFRHLYGTNDIKTFTTWLNALKQLHQFIVTNEGFDLTKELQLGVDIVKIARDVVPSLTEGISDAKLREMMEDSLLDVKLSAGGIK